MLDFIFHRNAAAQKHMSLFPNASSRLEHDLPTCICKKAFQPQLAMGLQIVICLLKFGQSWQILSSCVKAVQHAEQRLTLSSDERLKTRLEIENHSSVTTLDSLTNLVDLTLGPLSTWLTVQQFCGRLIASSFHETCCTRYQEENKDISKFAIDLHAYVASTICFMYSTWYESK